MGNTTGQLNLIMSKLNARLLIFEPYISSRRSTVYLFQTPDLSHTRNEKKFSLLIAPLSA